MYLQQRAKRVLVPGYSCLAIGTLVLWHFTSGQLVTSMQTNKEPAFKIPHRICCARMAKECSSTWPPCWYLTGHTLTLAWRLGLLEYFELREFNASDRACFKGRKNRLLNTKFSPRSRRVLHIMVTVTWLLHFAGRTGFWNSIPKLLCVVEKYLLPFFQFESLSHA